MINLVIGQPVNALKDTHTVLDYYEGLDYAEEHEVNSICFNMKDKHFSRQDILELLNFLQELKTPTLILSDHPSYKEFSTPDYIAVIPTDSNNYSIYNRYIEVLDYKSLFNQISSLSTQKRTLPFYLLGGLLSFEPLIKIFYFKLDTGFNFSTIFEIIFSIDSPVKFFEFWLLFPLAGLALFRATAYSLFVFAGVYIYSTVAYFSYEKFTWPYVQENPHISANLLLFFNTALLIYFLIPENRKPFANKTKFFFIRPKRTSLQLETILNYDRERLSVSILNISESGAMVSLKKKITSTGYIELEVDKLKLKCLFVREIIASEDGAYRYGLQFKFRDKQEKEALKQYISLEQKDLESALEASA